MIKHDITTFNQLQHWVAHLAQQHHKAICYLEGDLGTGKSTFVRYWLQQLGFSGAVPSPTYSLMNEYIVDNKCIIHADLYRLSDPEELIYLDIREWPDRADLIFIEWPEKGLGFLPKYDLLCQFSLLDKCRFLSIKHRIH